jgi:uncharacterized radical SAM superfamily Fe-S cluster-containing enzyme
VDLVPEKHAAIEACRDAELPVVLIPTVVPGVNDHEMGDIVRFALDTRDIVRSVNFQPVAHFGRYEHSDGRFPIDDAIRMLADQMDSLEPRDMLPAPCCSAYCQIGTAFVSEDASPGLEDTESDDGCGCSGTCESESFVPLTQFVDEALWNTLSGMVDEGDYMELLAGTAAGEEWACKTAGCCGVDAAGVEGLFEEVVPVSFTGFMDADAADVNRLSNCCISVPTIDGDLVPFCGYNMTTEDGEYALRNRNGWGGRERVEEPVGERYTGDSTTIENGHGTESPGDD